MILFIGCLELLAVLFHLEVRRKPLYVFVFVFFVFFSQSFFVLIIDASAMADYNRDVYKVVSDRCHSISLSYSCVIMFS